MLEIREDFNPNTEDVWFVVDSEYAARFLDRADAELFVRAKEAERLENGIYLVGGKDSVTLWETYLGGKAYKPALNQEGGCGIGDIARVE